MNAWPSGALTMTAVLLAVPSQTSAPSMAKRFLPLHSASQTVGSTMRAATSLCLLASLPAHGQRVCMQSLYPYLNLQPVVAVAQQGTACI